MRKSFTLLEIILVLLLISTLYTFFKPKTPDYKIDEATNKILIYLKQARYQALIDNKYDENNPLWFKKRWTLKFFRCRESVGGLYYVIYSDKNNTGQPSSTDSLKDSLTNKNIYSSNFCKEDKDNSEYVLLTQKYNIEKIDLTCNQTTSLGQLSFGEDGDVFTKLSNYAEEENLYKLSEICSLRVENSLKESRIIKINPKTGYMFLE